MNRVLRIDEEKPEMHISVQGYKVTLCFAEKENPEVAVLVVSFDQGQKGVQQPGVQPQVLCQHPKE